MPLDICPECGAERTNGLCPRCLVKLAMEGDRPSLHQPTDADSEATGAKNAAPAAPKSEGTGALTPGSTDQTIDHASRPGPIGDATTVDSRMGGLAPGTTVRYFGDYEIQKELGRGGMGVVYKALQVSLNRPVALKMIKAGVLADEAELQRFQNEAEAVALLDHPAIVPVYEVGEHDGQRYFSMKLVEAGNLAEKLATFKANPRAAATLLAETAEAVHHAHMRGILHRDLKPANILIDAEGHPHVTDFGLAKRVEGDVEMTASGAILGTPAYMSPEQANGRRGSITTATDVYGLGAVLYAMLAGKAPFGGDSVMETLDAVRTRPPDSPKKFNANVPHDLETICLKCLEKDPRRRYASARELASDLNNWLDTRPITARRVGATERAWLWCKRKPAIAALTGAVMLAMIAGTAAVFAVQSRANTKLKLANTALETERARVEIRERQAVEAINRFGDAIATEPALKNSPALNDLRRRLLREPISFFSSLRDQLQADAKTRPESLVALSNAVFQHATLSQAIGDREDAYKSLTESLIVLERLVREHPSELIYQGKLASSHQGLANVQSLIGQPRDARKSIERAREIYSDLVRQESPLNPEYRKRLAECHLMLGVFEHQAGRPAQALDLMRKARDEFEQLLLLSKEPSSLRASMVMCDIDAGGVEEVMGRFTDAISDYRRALGIADRLVRDNPNVTSYRYDQAQIHQNIGKSLSLAGKKAEGEAESEKSLALYEALVAEFPSIVDHQYSLAGCYLSLGSIAAAAGRMSDAEARLSKARGAFERLATDHPESPDFASELGATIHNLGQMQYDTKHFTQARDMLLQAMVWQRKALATNPRNPRYRECINAHLDFLSQAATAIGDKETVEQARQEKAQFAASDPRKAAINKRLADIVNGAKPDDNAERLALARQAFETARYALAARLRAEALAADPKLASDRQAEHRYNAARAAAMAASGQGKDHPKPDDAAKAKLRKQALDWLKAELFAWKRVSMIIEPGNKQTVAKILARWKQDADLAGIRVEAELAKLPEAERKEWQALWADVDALLKRVEKPTS